MIFLFFDFYILYEKWCLYMQLIIFLDFYGFSWKFLFKQQNSLKRLGKWLNQDEKVISNNIFMIFKQILKNALKDYFYRKISILMKNKFLAYFL